MTGKFNEPVTKFLTMTFISNCQWFSTDKYGNVYTLVKFSKI